MVYSRSISVVVPVFNAERSLTELVQRLTDVLEGHTAEVELILVNDGSNDDSWPVISKLRREFQSVVAINLSKNYGQHNALLCGIRAARYELIVTIDDDLQHPPEQVPVLLEALTDDFDVVYGYPAKGRHGLLRNMASRISKWALRGAMGSDVATRLSAFRVFRTRLRDGFEAFEGPHPSLDVLLTWSTARFGATRVEHQPRAHGKSNYATSDLFRHALNMATGFTTLPLQVASVAGFSFMLLGFALLVYLLVQRLLLDVTVEGFTFLASTVTIFAGVQLFALGVIGEYIARMHFRVMKRPAYVVRSQDGPND